ncbi:MAG: DUF433 domain-containing protein [Chromatiaceae bacterium]|nr:MAG: DUF433 domain-containing protein [Chromatiaceae bacterium]
MTTASTRIAMIPGVAGGQPYLAGHRIKVRDIVHWHEHLGRSPDEISAEYDPDLADIQAALAWYFDHRTGIAAAFAARDAFVATLRARQPSPLAARLIEPKDV